MVIPAASRPTDPKLIYRPVRCSLECAAPSLSAFPFRWLDGLMRVVLEIVSGPFEGRKTVLSTNDSLSVGRSDWAQLVCTYDERMSRVHFKVKTDEVGCYLVDHASRNGTFSVCALSARVRTVEAISPSP